MAVSARSGRPCTNRDVTQTPDTVFAINPEEWNNVPKIVYDCCYSLIYEADATRKRNAQVQAEVKNNFMESRTSIRNVEQGWQRESLQMKAQSDADARRLTDAQGKLQTEVEDKLNKIDEAIDEF